MSSPTKHIHTSCSLKDSPKLVLDVADEIECGSRWQALGRWETNRGRDETNSIRVRLTLTVHATRNGNPHSNLQNRPELEPSPRKRSRKKPYLCWFRSCDAGANTPTCMNFDRHEGGQPQTRRGLNGSELGARLEGKQEKRSGMRVRIPHA